MTLIQHPNPKQRQEHRWQTVTVDVGCEWSHNEEYSVEEPPLLRQVLEIEKSSFHIYINSLIDLCCVTTNQQDQTLVSWYRVALVYTLYLFQGQEEWLFVCEPSWRKHVPVFLRSSFPLLWMKAVCFFDGSNQHIQLHCLCRTFGCAVAAFTKLSLSSLMIVRLVSTWGKNVWYVSKLRDVMVVFSKFWQWHFVLHQTSCQQNPRKKGTRHWDSIE